MPPRLFVAYFRTLPFFHWALYIQHSPTDYELFEVAGASPKLKYNTRWCKNPEGGTRCTKTLELRTIAARNLGRLRRLAEDTTIDNSTVMWHCQHLVLDLIDRLEEEVITDIPQASLDKLKEDHEEYD